MADVISEQQVPAVPTKREEEALVIARRRAEAKVPRHRFGVAYLALAVLLGAAVGVTVVLATNDNSKSTTGAQWSAWHPVTTGTLGVREIARYIAPHYRLSSGGQMVGIDAGPFLVPTEQGQIPVSAILIASGTAGVRQQRIDVEVPQAGVFYQMCGTGPSCSIAGAPTNVRGQLLFREAVELGLYTFHYMPEADHVMVFIPPPRGVPAQDPQFHRVVYLPRPALTTELGLPLKRALPPGTTTLTPERLPAAERNAISGVVAGRVFHFDFQQAPDQSLYIILSPLPTGS